MNTSKSKYNLIDFLIYALIAVFFIFNFAGINYSGTDFTVVFTFFVIGVFSFVKIVCAKKNISISRIFYIFMFIFFFYAPLQQYVSGTVFWKSLGITLVYSDSDYLNANLAIIAFLFFYELAYNLLFTRKKKKPIKYSLRSSDRAIAVLNVISFLVLILLALSGSLTSSGEKDSNLYNQIIKIMRFYPVACFMLNIFQVQNFNKKRKLSIILLFIELVIIYFPFYGSISRFMLFGVYLMVISVLFSKFRYKSLYFLLFVVGFFFVFSAFNFFKYHSFSEISQFSLSYVDFNQADYDAYQLFMMTVKYVDVNGVCYGNNLLSSVLNFIPRSVWAGKCLPTGEVVSTFFGSGFTNLSCPVMGEFYFAFGKLGIVLGGFITGLVIKILDNFDYSESYIKRGVFCIISGMLIFTARGSLLPAFSYIYAQLISFGIVCALNYMLSKKSTSNKSYGLIYDRQ